MSSENPSRRRKTGPDQDHTEGLKQRLYKTGARGREQQEVRQRVQQEDGAEEQEEEGRRSRRIKSENHSQRFGKYNKKKKNIIKLCFMKPWKPGVGQNPCK